MLTKEGVGLGVGGCLHTVTTIPPGTDTSTSCLGKIGGEASFVQLPSSASTSSSAPKQAATSKSSLRSSSLPSKLKQKHPGYTVLAEDLLDHAISDAAYVLYCSETPSDLPWNSSEADLVIPGPWTSPKCFWYDALEDRCFSVSSDELLTPDEIYWYWPQVDAADRKEVASYLNHQVFDLHPNDASAHNRVDGVWVRK